MNIKTTSFPLRLSPELKELAKARAESIGLSLNALICVALDAYLRGPDASPPVRVPAPALVVSRRQPSRPQEAQQQPDLPLEDAPPPVTAPASSAALNRAQRRALKKRK